MYAWHSMAWHGMTWYVWQSTARHKSLRTLNPVLVFFPHLTAIKTKQNVYTNVFVYIHDEDENQSKMSE